MWVAALDALDFKGLDEFVVLLVRPNPYSNVRITFKKEPDLEPREEQITFSVIDEIMKYDP